MKHIFLTVSLVLGLAVLPAAAADKPAKNHAGKEHPHADKHADKKADAGRDKEKCAEMMEHNKADAGESADPSKKGCGMVMGKKTGVKKH